MKMQILKHHPQRVQESVLFTAATGDSPTVAPGPNHLSSGH